MSGLQRSTLAVGIVALIVGASLVGAGVALGEVGPGARSAGAMQLAPGSSGTNGKTITVAATGRAEAQPDKAIVRVAVEATANDPTAARRQVATNVSSMRDALAAMDINESAIRTTGFNIYEDRTRPPREGEEPEIRYRASHEFRIEVDDVDRVGTVIDTAVDSGATSVRGVQFTLSDGTREELRRRAIDEAMASARDQASTIAEGANLRVGNVRRVRTGGVPSPGPVPSAFLASAGDGGGTSIESGPVSITATVTVVYDASG